MQGRPLDEDLKAQIIASLLSGSRVADTARKFNIPHSTVSRIKSALSSEMDAVGQATRERIDDLIADSLAWNIKAQVSILRKFNDENYLDKTSASSLSEAYERFANHSIRLLEAASAVESDQDEEE